MDIDFKMVGTELNDEELIKIINEVINVDLESNINFRVLKLSKITAETKYGGKTISIEAKYYNIKKIFGVDIGFGDVVTPYPIDYNYKTPITTKECNILAYPIETSIAEKFETIISKGPNNSRSKDLVDIYLYMNQSYNCDLLNSSIINTFNIRKTKYDKKYIEDILYQVFRSERHYEIYENYRNKNSFANNITYEMCKNSVYKLFNELKFLDKIELKTYNVELHIIRHGESELDKVGGWSDSHLTVKGENSINSLLNEIDSNYDLFVSSDLNRAVETSNILNKKLLMDIVYKSEFREANNGDLKDLRLDDVKLRYPGLFFSSLKMNEKYPNGESPIEFYERIKKSFIELINTNQNKKILLVTHGGVIAVIMSLVYGYPYSNLLNISPGYGTISIIK